MEIAESSVSSSKLTFFWKIHGYKDTPPNRFDSPNFYVGKDECYLALEELPETKDWMGIFFCTRSQRVDARFSISIVDENKKELLASHAERKTMGKAESSYEWGFPKFFQGSSIGQYLRKGTLHIICDVEIFDAIIHQIRTTGDVSVPPDNTLVEDIARLIDSFPSDVDFHVDGVKISAHKIILSARSSVFRTMFASGMKEATDGVVKIKDITPVIFKEVITYMYSSKCNAELLSQNVNDFLNAAEKYDLAGLKMQCEKELLAGLDVNNMAELLELADTFRLTTVRNSVISYIVRNFKSIFPTKIFKEMCSKTPQLFAEIHDAVYPAITEEKASSGEEDGGDNDDKKNPKKRKKRS